MSIIVRLALAWLLYVVPLLPSEQCGLPGKVVYRLVHYQAWSDYWMGSRRGMPQNQKVKVLKNGAAWLVYSVLNRTVYRITESSVSASTCRHQNDWMKCLADLRTPLETTSMSDLLLGKVKSAGPLDTGSICTFSLSVSPAQAKWRPSEENEQKQQLVRLLSEEISGAVQSLGSVQLAVCSDFNVDDPQIWAVVNISKRTGTSSRLLVGVDVDHSVPPRMTASIIRDIAPNDAPLVGRVRRNSLRLSLLSR